jgi:glycine/D-amino acid oxidase-like deaminating enzyme
VLTSRHERPACHRYWRRHHRHRHRRALQREGHAVTLVDSGEPGRATSYGNAGFIAIDHVLPLARPSTLKRVPQMLMDRNGPLTVHPPSIPALLPWMARFALAAYSQAEVQKGVDSFGPLMAGSQRRLEGRDPGLGPGRALPHAGRALRLRK